MRAYVLLAGGLDWRSLSGQCYAADQFGDSLCAVMLACMLVVGDRAAALIVPDVSHEPVIHNPFPQLNKVAVAPFFN